MAWYVLVPVFSRVYRLLSTIDFTWLFSRSHHRWWPLRTMTWTTPTSTVCEIDACSSEVYIVDMGRHQFFVGKFWISILSRVHWIALSPSRSVQTVVFFQIIDVHVKDLLGILPVFGLFLRHRYESCSSRVRDQPMTTFPTNPSRGLFDDCGICATTKSSGSIGDTDHHRHQAILGIGLLDISWSRTWPLQDSCLWREQNQKQVVFRARIPSSPGKKGSAKNFISMLNY